MSRRISMPLAVLTLVIAACTTAPPTPTATPAPTGGPTAVPSSAPTSPAGGLLATIQARGQLICGVNGGLQGFSFLDNTTNTWSGFDADFCRAVAAAVFGDATKVEFRALGAEARGPALQTGEVDVLIRNTTWTAGRDSSWGNFAPTTFYDGQGMMVNRTLNPDAATLEDLAGATICVQTGTTTELNLADAMRVRNVEYTPLVFDNIDATYEAYTQDRCDAVTSDRSQLVGRRSGFTNPADHELLDVVMSKEPLGPVAPHGDDRWFDVVKWVVFATFQAEEFGITQANVAEMASTSADPGIRRFLGVQPEAGEIALGLGLADDWAVDVISAVGNYAEIYNRNLGPDTALALERGPNELWTNGGLLYAPPYR